MPNQALAVTNSESGGLPRYDKADKCSYGHPWFTNEVNIVSILDVFSDTDSALASVGTLVQARGDSYVVCLSRANSDLDWTPEVHATTMNELHHRVD